METSTKESIKSILGAKAFSDDPESLSVYAKDWTTYFEPKASAVVFPESSEQVVELVRLARKDRIALVPSGGRTGLSGGAVAKDGELVVSFERMNKIIDFNPIDRSLEVEAGVVTDEIKKYAEARDLIFPLSFGATGSSQIGGNIATNAGGANVLRYGNTRNWIMGLEVVTGAGEHLKLNQGLVKNATGYDLRHLMIGSEGSLGFITKALLKFAPKPFDSEVLLLACPDWKAIMAAFEKVALTSDVLAFEVVDKKCLEAVIESGHADSPFAEKPELMVLIEVEKKASDWEDRLNRGIDRLMADSLVVDAVLSQSEQQKKEIWAIRENITESISPRKPYKNDISVRPSRIPEFIADLEAKVGKEYPDFEVLWFGHIGDGNLHLNILKPEAMEVPVFVDKCRQVDQILFESVQKFAGSISAEHGVGLTKRDFLSFTRSSEEIEIMRKIKNLFDPDGIINPGKLLA